MSAERGWIADPPPPPPRDYIPGEQHKWRRRWAHLMTPEDRKRYGLDESIRAVQRAVEKTWAEQEAKNSALREIDYSHIPPLRIADRYAKRVSNRRAQDPEARK